MSVSIATRMGVSCMEGVMAVLVEDGGWKTGGEDEGALEVSEP